MKKVDKYAMQRFWIESELFQKRREGTPEMIRKNIKNQKVVSWIAIEAISASIN